MIESGLEISRLRAFMAVMETRHFANAARQLGMSQPGVSKNIKALEDQLKVRLFERGRHGAQPTAFAHALVRRAKLILAEGRLAAAEIEAMRGYRKGRLNVGAGLNFLPRILPRALHQFHQRWPGITVNVESGVSGSLFPALLNGDLDFVVSVPPDSPVGDELAQQRLYEDTQKLIVRRDHPLARIPPAGLLDLSPYPWLVSRGVGLWERICRAFLEAGVAPPQLFLETASDVLAKALIAQGDYLCLLGRSLYEPDVEAGTLLALPFAPLATTRSAFVTYRRRSPLSTPARNMIRAIRHECADLNSAGIDYESSSKFN